MSMCPICERERVVSIRDYEYAADAGLDTLRHSIVLKGIEVARCACGEAPRIPNPEGLHYMVGIALVCHEAPLDGAAIRFLRKTMGLTQSDFAEAAQMHSVTLSDWERGERLPEKRTRVFAALQFVHAFMQREESRAAFSESGLLEMLHAFVERNRAGLPVERQTSEFQLDSRIVPPAWQISEFQQALPASRC